MSTPAPTISPAIVDGLVARIEGLARKTERRVLIGIAGMPAAGKTTLAEALVTRLAGGPEWADSQVAHVPMDGFHLADAELRRLGLLDTKGAPETFDVAGYATLLRRIAAGESVWAPSFERSLEQPIAQSLPVTENTRIVISEGNYLLLPERGWRAARSAFTETWFVRVEEATRLRRLIWRHVEFGKSPVAARQWVLRSDEPNAQLVAPTVKAANLVIDLDR
ncbi:nucleoside/nucleotide kinase family protein [Jatrophihabitans sp.]|uniref:nucleoside/nucleotide kinase family protein n=1 Tax=Jatrophihabitans sp. TaxID=1932789 RepID=UPI0030C7465C